MSTRTVIESAIARTGRTRYADAVREHWVAYVMLMPMLVMLIGIFWIPMLRGVWMSLHNWPTVGAKTWVGFGNYRQLLADPAFHTSVQATAVFATVTVVQLLLALVAALIVADLSRFKSLVSAMLVVPYAMPPVVTGTMWGFILNPNVGPLFGWLTAEGYLGEPVYWKTAGELAMAVVMGVTAWTFWPFMFLIILANLEDISQEYYEAAEIYGAGRVQTFLRVTLPQIKSAILVAVSIRVIWNISKVSQLLQLTGGGPGYETSIISVFMYRFAWKQGRMGLAYAAGMILLSMVVGFILLFLREFERAEGQPT